MEKNRPIARNTGYDWYNWLISFVSKSVNKYVSDVKEKLQVSLKQKF